MPVPLREFHRSSTSPDFSHGKTNPLTHRPDYSMPQLLPVTSHVNTSHAALDADVETPVSSVSDNGQHAEKLPATRQRERRDTLHFMDDFNSRQPCQIDGASSTTATSGTATTRPAPRSLPSSATSTRATLNAVTSPTTRARRLLRLPPVVLHAAPGQIPRSSSKTVTSSSAQTHLPAAKTSPLSSRPGDERNIALPGLHVSSIKPPKRLTCLQKLYYHWLNAYQILISLAIGINLATLAVYSVMKSRPAALLVPVSVNLLIAVLIRQEYFINASFSVIARTPRHYPLLFRKLIADFHHYGGVHIGCSVSALIWYVAFVVENTRLCAMYYRQGATTVWLWGDVVTSYLFMLFLLFICITALPGMREKFHDMFEYAHRFAGWTALVVLWVHTAIAAHSPLNTSPLASGPTVYILGAFTLLIIWPWLRMRRVPVRASHISKKEVRLTFPYANMAYTSTMRFSRSPLTEWHAFATIPAADGFTADILVSGKGDWTDTLIASPPTSLWIRNPPASNFLACVPLFSSVLLVATGAGIGPMLSLLASPAVAAMQTRADVMRIMWCVADPEAPRWAFVQDAIRSIDSDPRIFSSKVGGVRPDLPFEVAEMVRAERIEAVMVVSNKVLTEAIGVEVRRVGGAAYGAVFDS